MRLLKNELLSRHTTFRVGGPCDVLINPESSDELISVIRDLKQKRALHYVIGNGSNLLVRDEGIRATVVEISREISKIEILTEMDNEVIISAEAGASLAVLSSFAYREGLAGAEFAGGIPGTVGGAVFMNAGAYDGEISGVLVSTQYYDGLVDEVREIDNEAHVFGYRKSVFQENNGIIMKSIFKFPRGDKVEIKRKMDDYSARRREKQPLEFPSAGSTFKRPKGSFAGKLIENAGLRGYKIGGAQVAEKHCGFIINRCNASAEDILKLIDYVKEEVLKKFGIELEEEVRIL